MSKLKSLPTDSKIWIFPAASDFSKEQSGEFEEAFSVFIRDWKAHGHQVTADFEIFADRFVVVAANESEVRASGCSIDALTRSVQELLQSLGLGIASVSDVFYREGGDIQQVSRLDFTQLAGASKISSETHVFDLTISDLGSYIEGRLERPFAESWHAKAFKIASA
jgi:hypothetical protein